MPIYNPTTSSSSGSGNVTGPASSTNNAVVRFDGTTGQLLKDSTTFIDNSGNLGVGTSSIGSTLTVNGVSQFGTSAWPTNTFTQNGNKVLITSTNLPALILNMAFNPTLGGGGEIYLGARGTDNTNDSAYVRIQGLRENATSGNYATQLVLKTMNATASEVPGLKINSSGQTSLGGNLVFDTDNSYDIGASGATRPKNYYGSGTVITGGNITGNNLTMTGDILQAAGNFIYWNGRGKIQSPADGIIELSNNAVTDFSRLQLGGTTSSFPALKRNSTGIDFRLADDSAYAPIIAQSLTVHSAVFVDTDAAIDLATSSLRFRDGYFSRNLNIGGKMNTYNGITTVTNGVPSLLATIDSTGLTANVGATTLYAVPASGEGMYRVSTYLVTTTAGSLSSTMPNAQIVYTDKDSNTSVTLDSSPVLGAAGEGQSGLLTANTVGTVFSGEIVIYVKASTTIQYLTTNYASNLAGMTYALRIRLEAI